jgi:hypothetical protein
MPDLPARPARKNLNMVSVHGKKPLKDVSNSIPAKAILAQTNNNGIKACCRDTNNLTHEAFYDADDPDKEVTRTVISCTKCNCNHYRIGGTKVRK